GTTLDERAGDHLDAPSTGQVDNRNLRRLDVAVPGRLHLLDRRQVDPKLEAPHPAPLLLRHLRVDDAAAGGHPLHPAALEVPGMAEVILVPQVTVEHV